MNWLWLALLIAVFAAPFVRETLRKPVAPKTAPGKFADLSMGRTHYRWFGPVRGPVVVAIHGLSTPHQAFEQVAQGLGGLAFRTLAYDLPGRGHSQSVSGPYTAQMFVQQLKELLDHEGLREDITLVGYSLGGQIAAEFAAQYPEMLTRIVLIAPSGIDTVEEPLDRFARQVPVLGTWLHRVVEPMRLKAALDVDSPMAPIIDQQLSRRGYLPSILASRRGLLSESAEAAHRKVARDSVPTYAIWGDADLVVPISGIGQLAQWNRAASQEVVKGAGHGLPHTHPEEVVAVLRNMLRERV